MRRSTIPGLVAAGAPTRRPHFFCLDNVLLYGKIYNMAEQLKIGVEINRFKRVSWLLVAVLLISPLVIFAAPSPLQIAGDIDIASTTTAPIQIAKSPNDPRFYEQTNLNQIRIPSAWDVSTGDSNLVIALIDTGVNQNHEELAGRLWTNTDEVPNNGLDDDRNGYTDDYIGYDFMANTADITDQNGHGTGVASIIAANTNNSKGMAGINWNSKIMVLKALNSGGGGDYDDVARAIRYAADNGAKIINMSFGTYFASSDLEDAVAYAIARNVTIVSAAGNNNQNQLLSPASYSSVISVGAVDSAGQRASFSNYGNNLDVVAPGVNILMANYVGTNAYVYGSGSSFATAHVTGLASLILSRNPSLSPTQVENILKTSAVGTGNFLEYGEGIVNAASALGSSQITDHITGRITTTSTHVVADNQTPIRVVIQVTNNDFPLANHQIRAYINGPITYNDVTVDKQEIYLGTTDNSGTISFVVRSAVAGKKVLIFSDTTAGVSLGELTLTFDPLSGIALYAGVKVAQSEIGVLAPGESATLWVDIKNTGNVPWLGADSLATGQMRLGTTRLQDRTSKFFDQSWVSVNRPATLGEAIVNPGETGRFTITLKAPESGVYKEYFAPVVEYVTWLSAPLISWDITVSKGGVDPVASHYNADILYRSGYLTMSPGQMGMLQIEFKNTGTAEWVDDYTSSWGAVKLGTVSPYDRTSPFQSGWLSGNRVMDVGSTIAPGGRVIFAFPIKAPVQPGLYVENFRLVSEYITWFAPAITWEIRVQ